MTVFADFNAMRDADHLNDHPDAAPVGADGERPPASDGWRGIRPTREDHRRDRMAAFRWSGLGDDRAKLKAIRKPYLGYR